MRFISDFGMRFPIYHLVFQLILSLSWSIEVDGGDVGKINRLLKNDSEFRLRIWVVFYDSVWDSMDWLIVGQ